MKYPIYFAPLQGFTEDIYRGLHHEIFGGVDRYYTPFVRWEKGVRNKDVRDLNPTANQGVPVVPQLIAKDGEEMEQLLQSILPLGYTQVDVNMGCPFPLQTRHGRGAGILPHPDKVAELTACMAQHPEVTFSVKMRLGLEDAEEWRQVLPILNDTPLSHITLHPRIASQQYKGSVNREAFEAFLLACQHPVVYNGDITTIEQIQELEQLYGERLQAVMIGRGLLARPCLAWEYQNDQEMDSRTLIRKIQELHARFLTHTERAVPDEHHRLNKLQSFWEYLEPTIGRKPWKKITKAGNLKNYLNAVHEI